jgi:hypothetical protein
VNYHVTELARSGLLELRGERQVRGAIEHFYRPAARPDGRPNGNAPEGAAHAEREPAPAAAG